MNILHLIVVTIISPLLILALTCILILVLIPVLILFFYLIPIAILTMIKVVLLFPPASQRPNERIDSSRNGLVHGHSPKNGRDLVRNLNTRKIFEGQFPVLMHDHQNALPSQTWTQIK